MKVANVRVVRQSKQKEPERRSIPHTRNRHLPGERSAFGEFRLPFGQRHSYTGCAIREVVEDVWLLLQPDMLYHWLLFQPVRHNLINT